MSEQERKEQEKHRTSLVDLSHDDDHHGSGDDSINTSNGAAKNGKTAGKMASLFEIQNTLDDTFPLENGNGIKTTVNGNADSKLFVADTESEDEEEDVNELKLNGNTNKSELNESMGAENTTTANNTKRDLNNTSGCADFHLEMSESINQSNMSAGEWVA